MSPTHDAPDVMTAHDRPWGLRAEHLDTAFGIGVRTPRLSWRLPDRVSEQFAYQVSVSLGDSSAAPSAAVEESEWGWIESAEHVLVPWPGEPLAARQQVTCRVRVRTDHGLSDWSEPLVIEAGLDRDDWTASWISPAEEPRPAPGQRPGYLLRGRITVAGQAKPARARAYVTAHGIYELFVNGTRVGDAELTPGYTSYRVNLNYQTYDLTDLLVPGENVIGVILSDGWYRGRVGYYRQPDAFGAEVAALVQIETSSADGGRSVFGSDAEWEWTTGPIVTADLMDGQAVDLRLAKPGWATGDGGSDGANWRPVRLPSGPEYDLARLRVSEAPPVRVVEQLAPAKVQALASGRTVVDFGQNINGWVRLRNLGDRSLRLTHGEALAPDGDVTVDHLAGHAHRPEGAPPPEPALLPVGQYDTVIGTAQSNDDVAFRHTTHGFQYLRIEGDTEGLDPADVSAEVVHTDLRRTGWFACSDDRLNRLHDAAVWSFRGNACDVPTDCPHRERAGWTGDWQLYLPTASFLYDVAGFSVKWLHDLVADQRDNGIILNFAPEPNAAPGGVELLPPPWNTMQGSSGWAEAIVIVPWELYRAYGDTEVLNGCYPAMQRWLDYCIHEAATKRHRALAQRRPETAAHEKYLWDTGYHWGEWLEPVESGHDPFGEEGIVATAYFYRAADLLAQIATVIGRDEDAGHYRELANNVRDAWQTEYISADGRLARDTQATYARALTFGLLPERLVASASQRLADLVQANGNHLSTGFLSTPMLLPRLADAGYWDVAFDLLFQNTVPSWLVMIDRGATTIWEGWEGLNDAGEPKHSLNHYSKGAVISFLHSHVVGLRAVDGTPGWERFVVHPHVNGPLTWAKAVHDSPYGRIEAGWERDDGHVRISVVVPPGTSGLVRLPDGSEHEIGVGSHDFTITRGSAG